MDRITQGEVTRVKRTRPPEPDTQRTLNGRLYDDAIERQVDLLTYREGLVSRVGRIVAQNDRTVFDRLGNALGNLSGADVTRLGQAGRLRGTTTRLEALDELFFAFGRDSARLARGVALKELRQLAFDEAVFWADRVGHHLPTALGISIERPTRSAVNDLWRNTLLFGESIPDLINRWGRQRTDLLKSFVRRSFSEGLTTNAVIEGVRARRGVLARSLDGSPSGLGQKLRSASNASWHAGQKALAAENDLINDLVWTSVLDGRTSDICISRHGRLVNKELNGALPPAHPNCVAGEIDISLIGDAYGVFKRRWKGIVYVIRTAAGLCKLTPRHPVATLEGWKPASELKRGDITFTHIERDRCTGHALFRRISGHDEAGRWKAALEGAFHGDAVMGEPYRHARGDGAREAQDELSILDIAERFKPAGVLSVTTEHYNGWVYNFETDAGCYDAGGVIVHNCRSITVPGIYNARRAQELQRRLPADELDLQGRIPEHETAATWFRRQPLEVKRRILGPNRLQMYEDGVFKFPDDFIRSPDGKRWTLETLRERSRAN